MSDTPPSDRPPVASDDLLPPVEPPSAGFIIQLFVVPALIVAIVVLLWVGINWLASPGRQDPEAIVRGLRSSGQTRFQQAEELASMMRMEASYPELKKSVALADGLAELLEEEVAAAAEHPDDDAESAVRMRMFLSAALGEFHVPAGGVDEPLGALLETARRDPNDHVRRRAIGAIAVLSGWYADQKNPQSLTDPEMVATFAELADSANPLNRSAAAFTLGVLVAGPDPDPELANLLAELAEDFYYDARYNAAVGLARSGDLRAAPVLAEMLDLEAIQASVESETAVGPEHAGPEPPKRVVAALRAEKRDAILKNALSGIAMLLDHHEPADLPQAHAALEEFLAAADQVSAPRAIPDSLINAAREVAKRFN